MYHLLLRGLYAFIHKHCPCLSIPVFSCHPIDIITVGRVRLCPPFSGLFRTNPLSFCLSQQYLRDYHFKRPSSIPFLNTPYMPCDWHNLALSRSFSYALWRVSSSAFGALSSSLNNDLRVCDVWFDFQNISAIRTSSPW